jgi:hypothetical protein
VQGGTRLENTGSNALDTCQAMFRTTLWLRLSREGRSL